VRVHITRRYKLVLQTRLFRPLLLCFFNVVDKVHKYRMALESDLNHRSEERLQSVLTPAFVRSGFFKGLQYEGVISHGSQYYPKLIGSYEEPIQKQIQNLLDPTPDLIVDIGCAEGYYAVGLARQFLRNQIRVIAIDTDRKALKQCSKLARINSVEEHIAFYNSFNEDIFKEISKAKRPFILCDCEGCEHTIFNQANIKEFNHCILAIELHEFVVHEIEVYLKALFRTSHELILIKDEKRNFNKYKVLNGLSYYAKNYAVNERRPVRMKWLFAIPTDSI